MSQFGEVVEEEFIEEESIEEESIEVCEEIRQILEDVKRKHGMVRRGVVEETCILLLRKYRKSSQRN